MRLRLTISLDIKRSKKTEDDETPNIIEVAGSTTEIRPQPSYIGFSPNEEVVE